MLLLLCGVHLQYPSPHVCTSSCTDNVARRADTCVCVLLSACVLAVVVAVVVAAVVVVAGVVVVAVETAVVAAAVLVVASVVVLGVAVLAIRVVAAVLSRKLLSVLHSHTIARARARDRALQLSARVPAPA